VWNYNEQKQKLIYGESYRKMNPDYLNRDKSILAVYLKDCKVIYKFRVDSIK